MADEGLHEIQLNGKQLVFLFMASTVVAVVIFLCGVMVGRGVRAQRAGDLIEAPVDASADPTAPTPRAPSDTASTTVSGSTPVAPDEKLTYPNRLEGKDPPEDLKEPVATVVPFAAPAKAVPAKIGAAKPGAAKPAPTIAGPSSTSGEPSGNGFVVQVAAVNDRREAETIARRLTGKGYPSFVTTPGNGTSRMFRVRVGKYNDRREAESIARRLQKEEQFKPWVTR